MDDFNVCPAGTCRREDEIKQLKKEILSWVAMVVQLSQLSQLVKLMDKQMNRKPIDLITKDQAERRTW